MSERELNKKQRDFCAEYVACGNYTQAYKAAYKVKSDAVAAVKGSNLVRNGKVAKLIAELSASMDNEKVMNAQKKREKLAEMINDPDVSNTDKLRAIDIDNKMEGLYIQKTQLSGSVDTGDIIIEFSNEVDDGDKV